MTMTEEERAKEREECRQILGKVEAWHTHLLASDAGMTDQEFKTFIDQAIHDERFQLK
jgi:hypothetical protein